MKTALEGVRDALGGTAVTSGAVAPVLAAGAAGTPSLSFTGDANTGLWSPAADTIAASTAGSERLRVDSAGLITGTGTSLGAWTAYTPTLGGTGWAIGNGVLTAAYCQIGKVVNFRIKCVFGSTSTFGASAAATFTLPITGQSVSTEGALQGLYRDVSLSVNYPAVMKMTSTTTLRLDYIAQATATQATTSATLPFTWADGDLVYISGTYEAA